MIGEIICVGNELLIGDTLNTNTHYLSKALTELGIEVGYQVVVGDHEVRLLEAISVAKKRSDIIIFSGGLGPTYDDMTKETVAKALGMPMVLDESALETLKALFKGYGKVMAKSNIKQAYRPSEASMITNNNGTAPGIHILKENTHFILLPGPPRELIPMFEEEVKPILEKLSEEVITSRIFKLVGIGESDLVSIIGHIMDHSINPRIAPYASLGLVNIRLTAKTSRADEGAILIQKTTDELMPYIKPYCFTYEKQLFEEVIIEILKEQKSTIAVAESCTGGLLSSRLINVSGASSVYKNGFITYANEAKVKWLEVEAELIEKNGAVSQEVAKAMAEGVKNVSNTTFGIGITGIAGPGGGGEDKPVGTVYIGIATPERTYVTHYQFNGNRQKIRDYSAQNALLELYKIIKESVD